MKYFVNSEERVASGHENYVEFQLSTATEEFWDKTSLYMLESTMKETGFGEFWYRCMQEDVVFDMGTLCEEDLAKMIERAINCSDTVLEVVCELIEWIEVQNAEVITVNWSSDHALSKNN